MEISKKIKENLGIEFEGLYRGENFIEFFSQELNNLKIKNNSSLELEKLLVYDKKKGDFICLEVVPEDFQNELKQLYKKFIRNNFLIKYQWYSKFLLSISNTLEMQYNINKNYIKVNEFFYDSLTTIFLLNFDMKNVYDYDKVSKSMVDMFNSIGYDLYQSVEMKDKFMQGFIKENLIKLEKDFFFHLTDPCISVLFGVTSIFLPDVFARNDFSIKYSSQYNLENLEFFLKNFKNFLENYDSFNLYRGLIYEKNPEILIKMDNYNDINSFNFEDFSINDKQALLIMYFIKLLVNEFCFQTVVMSCFESYFFSKYTKNILFSKDIFELTMFYKNDY